MPIKTRLRNQLKEKLSQLSAEEWQVRSSQVCHRLIEQSEYQQAEIIMAFLSLPGEINTAPIVLRAWQDNKRVLAPQVTWEQRRMIPVEISSLNEAIEETTFQVRQPTTGQPIPVDMIDLVLVPGLGFDLLGNRLGRGRGFYDRFLAHPNFRGHTIALAIEEQIVAEIPAQPHDRCVDMVITERRVWRCQPVVK
ncbi:MAG: putative protein YqgN [Phycisphaerae bacterium]|nr:putative protein YqgN [Phycisphaerae bacterium]